MLKMRQKQGVGLDKADCLLEVDPVMKSVHMTHQKAIQSSGLFRGVGEDTKFHWASPVPQAS